MNISITALSKAIALLTHEHGRQNIVVEHANSPYEQSIKYRLSFVRDVFGEPCLQTCTIIKPV